MYCLLWCYGMNKKEHFGLFLSFWTKEGTVCLCLLPNSCPEIQVEKCFGRGLPESINSIWYLSEPKTVVLLSVLASVELVGAPWWTAALGLVCRVFSSDLVYSKVRNVFAWSYSCLFLGAASRKWLSLAFFFPPPFLFFPWGDKMPLASRYKVGCEGFPILLSWDFSFL